MKFPHSGRKAEEVLEDLDSYARNDFDPHSKRMWGHVYYAGLKELVEVVRRAYLMYMDKTMLDFTTFPSLLKMENEVVGAAANLLGGDDGVVGCFTYGGTESIMLALKAAREKFRKEKGKDAVPEVVLPATAHPAFWKSAEYLGMRVRRAAVDDGFRADLDSVNELAGRKTALIAGSAPNYPFGVVDDINGLSDIAVDRDIWLHVDACLGGFSLPFFKKLGERVPDFDFRIEGVSSISADFHKYGFAPRGSSVVLYREAKLREGQIFVMASWPGYPLVNTAVLSTRSAGTLAATWAVINYLGMNGYLELAKRMLYAKRRLIEGLAEVGLELLGDPEGAVVAFTSPDLNLFHVSSIMAGKGWYVQSQPGSKQLGYPKSLHFSINPGHADVVEEFIEDMKHAVDAARKEYPDVSNFDISKIDYESVLENMEIINELIHSMPPEVVESTFRYFINESIFRP
ncbi:pyridoxal phosphate-dependent decarboxylase family protein [Archaeoglobus neptunius]|uniref:pyridoxal phosphate-dependent decarboxylase family protein n=1 Tax=Archaeoglobus neptunius TaxID=2798580 RepID=UPI0019253F61|nr:aspartate aminotransferase family protein [Archaeoglobus neptunius]